MLAVVALADVRNLARLDVQSGLLEDLAHDRFGEQLAGLLAAAGQIP